VERWEYAMLIVCHADKIKQTKRPMPERDSPSPWAVMEFERRHLETREFTDYIDFLNGLGSNGWIISDPRSVPGELDAPIQDVLWRHGVVGRSGYLSHLARRRVG
jgi:hypothetical protein